MWHLFKTRHFFSKKEKERILDAIRAAEHHTSGEIRVHVESFSGGDPLFRGKQVFEMLGMAGTQLRNGVLIYLAVQERKFAILGDQGIDQVVPENFWDDVKETMQQYFQVGRFDEGICQGIGMVGQHLEKHFPYAVNDQNELTDEISEGK